MKSLVMTPPLEAWTMISGGNTPFGGYFRPRNIMRVGSTAPVLVTVMVAVNLSFSFPVVLDATVLTPVTRIKEVCTSMYDIW
jgi:hypothetical protein